MWTIEDVAFAIVHEKGEEALAILTEQNKYDIGDPKEWTKLLDDLLNHNIEICPNCETWCISYMLMDYYNAIKDGKCDHCRGQSPDGHGRSFRRFQSDVEFQP